MIYIYFLVIALMRTVQSVFSKLTGGEIKNNKALFLYTGYNNAVSAVLGFAVLLFTGFYGFNGITVAIAAAYGLMLALSVAVNIEAVKIVQISTVSMFANAAVLIPAVYGVFFLTSLWGFFNGSG